ncbi:unnamed protein product [Citrullus colocynthis]|uniref:Uncharacterized protein n=1 Tax=Citrullus colocynthis TaxID=252529 RepID=A0ABP0XVC6_9ROSI
MYETKFEIGEFETLHGLQREREKKSFFPFSPSSSLKAAPSAIFFAIGDVAARQPFDRCASRRFVRRLKFVPPHGFSSDLQRVVPAATVAWVVWSAVVRDFCRP